jgi:hypothetical protein
MSRSETELLGLDAQHVLNSPAFNKAMEALIEKTCQQWRDGSLASPAAREDAYQFVRATLGLRGELQRMLDDMKVSAHRAAQAEKRNSDPRKLS